LKFSSVIRLGRRLSCRRLSVDNENKIDEEEEEECDKEGGEARDNKGEAKKTHEERRKKLLHNEEFRRSFETKRLKVLSWLLSIYFYNSQT